MPNRKRSDATTQRLQRPEDFNHHFWRRHRRPHVLDEFVPELLSTDGVTVRRMTAHGKHLVFQEFQDHATASLIMERIEASVNSGIGMAGFALFEGHDALAILHTGHKLEPGWLAYPVRTQTAGRPPMPTLPMRVLDMPSLRIVGGACVSWQTGRYQIDAAIEQRGHSFEAAGDPVHLLDHVVGWRLRITRARDDRAVEVRLDDAQLRCDGFHRAGPLRAEASFQIPRELYPKLVGDDGHLAWFVLEFDDGLFCLPEAWRRWWFLVDVADRVETTAHPR